tara:strand:- start:1684 stop:2817 length:1134 start_codon:yes stop_codon:yes gene_type:complete
LFNGFFGTYYPSYGLVKEANTNSKIDLNIDYLDNLPINDYILGPGDKIKIIVSREYEELSSTTTIDGEGTIYVPRLNRIYVEGLTLNELNKILNKAFRKFVKFPAVEVQVIEYRPIRVFVQGEVENPGLQLLEGSFFVNNFIKKDSELSEAKRAEIDTGNIRRSTSQNYKTTFFPTVFDALRESGGITHFSDLSNIKLIRRNNLSNGSGKIQTTLNFEDVLTTGDTSQNIRIYDSDVIIVGKSDTDNKAFLRKAILSNLNPKFIEVFVTGRIKRPGLTKVSKANVLSDAVDIAGGAKVLRGPVTFLRFNNDGTIDKRKFGFSGNATRGSYENPYLKSGDLIVIGDYPLASINQIITEFTSPIVGMFSTYGLIKAIND